jgi:hypothetical protein
MLKRDFLWVSAVVAIGGAGAVVACGSEAVGSDLTAPDASSEASSSGSSTTSGGGRTPDDAGVTADGGIDPPEAGAGGNTTTIACGATTCPIPAETCCVSELQAGGNNSFACVVGTTCPAPPGGGDTAALKCSGQANCATGTVCCIRIVADGDDAASECKASCTGDEAQLCDLKAGDAGGCPAAAPCSNSNIDDWGQLPRGFATCGGRGN